MDLTRITIAVACGGPGAEREVSLLSGEAIHRGLTHAGLRALKQTVSGDPAEIEALECDLVFIALHGEFGEDGAIQELLDKIGIPYTASSAACAALTINKIATKERLLAAGLPTPRWGEVCAGPDAEKVLYASRLSLPVVVKPASRGSSVGTSIVRELSALEPAVDLALKFDRNVLIEEFVDGRELTAGMLGNEILPLVELRTGRAFYDYDAKYTDENTTYLCPAPLEENLTGQLQSLSREVIATLGVRDFGRVDLMLGRDGPMILEVNTIPGFTSHSLLPMAAAEAGISFSGLCVRIVELAWNRYMENNERKRG